MTSMNDPHRYDDMLDLPHPTSKKHPRMSAMNRAAQFSAFKALTGYDDAVTETARLTDRKVELTEDEKAGLDETMHYLQAHLKDQPRVLIRYFRPDDKKEGGAYQDAAGYIHKIDSYRRRLLLRSDAESVIIPMDQIMSIELL